MAEETALDLGCKTCGGAVVGSSITGEGHVCRRHNEIEWGRALGNYWPEMSAALLRPTTQEVPTDE